MFLTSYVLRILCQFLNTINYIHVVYSCDICNKIVYIYYGITVCLCFLNVPLKRLKTCTIITDIIITKFSFILTINHTQIMVHLEGVYIYIYIMSN